MSFPIDEAITNAIQYKEKGNALLEKAFDCKDHLLVGPIYSQALREYHNGYLLLRSVDVSECKKEGFDELLTGFLEEKQKKTDEQKNQIILLKIALWNNMSLIYMKQKKHDKVENTIENILILDPNNEKALIKGIYSGIELKNFEKTKEKIARLEKLNNTKNEDIDKFKNLLENKMNKEGDFWKEKLKNAF